MKIAAIILITLFSLNLTGANKPKAPKRAYSSHKFYFAAWGAAGSGSDETQLARMKVLAAAGVTDLLPGGDAKRLAQLIKLADQCGIRIHAWHWMMNVGGSKECREHPDWYSVNRLGQSCRDFHPYVDYYNFLSPFSPGAREYIKNGVREIAKVKGLASVHFDYIRYVDVLLGAELQTHYKHNGGPLVQDRLMAEYDFDYHPLARKAFKEQFGTDPMELPDKEENAAWKQFRMNAITSLVEECVQICHEEGTRASAAVFPFPQLAREYVKQDWAHWSLDTFFPMVYKKDHQGNLNWVGFATQEGVREMKKGQDLFTGLSVDNYGDNMEEFEEAIKQAHDHGARGVAFYHANALKEQHLAVIKKLNDLYNK
ncbi:MAG: family 10 glycosylhydrolase [Bacteroidia bacterium]|jgi:uncharacterized lipoprotein YddW (UPF0748 family)|nr:family 10 glycosylhydrolase [Bacteroidia bacterium]